MATTYDLPASGTLAYNGHVFSSYRRTRIRGKPLYDRAERAVVAVVYTISVTDFVSNESAGQGVNSDFALIRRRLEQPGQGLLLSDTGFGDLTINSGDKRDVMWGPKPRMLSWEPIGGRQTCMLEWECEVAVPECAAARYAFAVMAFNYSTDYSLDADGLQRRVFSGYLEIPMTRVVGARRPIPDNPDRYWPEIQPEIPAGFRRLQRDRQVSEDRRKLTFTVVDQQMPTQGGLPAGVVEATGRFGVSSSQTMLTQWTATLSANYTLGPGVSKARAWDSFSAILVDRVTHLKRSQPGVSVWETDFKADEGLYLDGHRCSFSASYYFLSSITQVLTTSGLWRPAPGTDWRTWAQSLAPTLTGYGNGGLRDSSAGDAVIDLCGGGFTAELSARSAGISELRAVRPVTGPMVSELKSGRNWVGYKCELDVRVNPHAVRHVPMGDVKLAGGRPVNVPGQADKLAGLGVAAGGLLQNVMKVKDEDKVQYRANGSYDVVLRGSALRAGEPVVFPSLLNVGGRVAKLASGRVGQWVVGSFGGRALLGARWSFRYYLEGAPAGKVDVPPNPVAQLN